jgi:hypothetical protein
LRCFLADPGQSFELIDKPSDGFGEVRHHRSPAGVRKQTGSMLSREAVRIIPGSSNLRFPEAR